MNDDVLDQLTIRQILEDWVITRDARLWDRFRPLWHDDGVMMATWFQGSAEEFIRMNDEGFAKAIERFVLGASD